MEHPGKPTINCDQVVHITIHVNRPTLDGGGDITVQNIPLLTELPSALFAKMDSRGPPHLAYPADKIEYHNNILDFKQHIVKTTTPVLYIRGEYD